MYLFLLSLRVHVLSKEGFVVFMVLLEAKIHRFFAVFDTLTALATHLDIEILTFLCEQQQMDSGATNQFIPCSGDDLKALTRRVVCSWSHSLVRDPFV